MLKRVFFGLLMTVGTLGLLWGDWALARRPSGAWQVGLPVAAVICALAVIGFGELRRIAAAAGVSILPVAGRVGVALVADCPYLLAALSDPWHLAAGAEELLLLLGIVALLAFGEQMVRHRVADGLIRLAGTFLAVGYLGVTAAVLLQLRLTFDLPALLWFLAAVKFTDAGAYFIGRAIGRHKLLPWLSPGKTWEGLVGGLAFGAAAGALTVWLVPFGRVTVVLAALGGAALGLAGQFGDLCESLLKRSGNLKDSGEVVPEFGGVLDIIDSPLLAAPVGYVLLAWLA